MGTMSVRLNDTFVPPALTAIPPVGSLAFSTPLARVYSPAVPDTVFSLATRMYSPSAPVGATAASDAATSHPPGSSSAADRSSFVIDAPHDTAEPWISKPTGVNTQSWTVWPQDEAMLA